MLCETAVYETSLHKATYSIVTSLNPSIKPTHSAILHFHFTYSLHFLPPPDFPSRSLHGCLKYSIQHHANTSTPHTDVQTHTYQQPKIRHHNRFKMIVTETLEMAISLALLYAFGFVIIVVSNYIKNLRHPSEATTSPLARPPSPPGPSPISAPKGLVAHFQKHGTFPSSLPNSKNITSPLSHTPLSPGPHSTAPRKGIVAHFQEHGTFPASLPDLSWRESEPSYETTFPHYHEPALRCPDTAPLPPVHLSAHGIFPVTAPQPPVYPSAHEYYPAPAEGKYKGLVPRADRLVNPRTGVLVSPHVWARPTTTNTERRKPEVGEQEQNTTLHGSNVIEDTGAKHSSKAVESQQLKQKSVRFAQDSPAPTVSNPGNRTVDNTTSTTKPSAEPVAAEVDSAKTTITRDPYYRPRNVLLYMNCSGARKELGVWLRNISERPDEVMWFIPESKLIWLDNVRLTFLFWYEWVCTNTDASWDLRKLSKADIETAVPVVESVMCALDILARQYSADIEYIKHVASNVHRVKTRMERGHETALRTKFVLAAQEHQRKEQQRLEHERTEARRLETQQLEHIRIEEQRLEQQRLEQQRLDQQRLEKEQQRQREEEARLFKAKEEEQELQQQKERQEFKAETKQQRPLKRTAAEAAEPTRQRLVPAAPQMPQGQEQRQKQGVFVPVVMAPTMNQLTWVPPWKAEVDAQKRDKPPANSPLPFKQPQTLGSWTPPPASRPAAQFANGNASTFPPGFQPSHLKNQLSSSSEGGGKDN